MQMEDALPPELVAELPLHLTRFHPMYKLKNLEMYYL